MGEIAEMMLDGTLCEACGCYMDDDGAAGFPRYCSEACARGRGMLDNPAAAPKHRRPMKATPAVPMAFGCDACGRRFRSALAAAQHARDKHGAAT